MNISFYGLCATPAHNRTQNDRSSSSMPTMNVLNHDTVSFKAVTPDLTRLLKGILTDGAELWSKMRRGIIPKTDDNVTALAKEWHKRTGIAEKKHIADPMLEFWKIKVEEVKID